MIQKKTVGGRSKTAGTPRQTAATKRASAAKAIRGRNKVIEEEDDDGSDADVIMIDPDADGAEEPSESDAEDLFVGQRRLGTKSGSKGTSRVNPPVKKAPTTRTRRAPATKQSTLNFSQASIQRIPTQRATTSRATRAIEEVILRALKFVGSNVDILQDEEEISDDDVFETLPSSRTARR